MRRSTMGKNGNGEGSIYEHKRNGKKVGYRGAYTAYTANGPKRHYVSEDAGRGTPEACKGDSKP